MKKTLGYLTHSGVRVGVLKQDTKTGEFLFQPTPRNFYKLEAAISQDELQEVTTAISNDIAFIKDNPSAVQTYMLNYDAELNWCRR